MKIFLVAETGINFNQLRSYLHEIGAPDWSTDTHKDGEILAEIAGKLCYRSFSADLNQNLTKVREGNTEYLANIIKSGHGSVLEHMSASFIFVGVSRVFTHELVRHRIGVGISQESLRFVRLEDFEVIIPEALKDEVCIDKEDFEEASFWLKQCAEETKIAVSRAFSSLKIDKIKSFSLKKKITSWVRRILPIGVSTSILWTANMRTLRHVIELRTSIHAEEEIRAVFQEVGRICKLNWPNIFQDFELNSKGEWKSSNPKI